MRVNNITCSQYKSPEFKGKIDIIPGGLSYEPAKYLRKSYEAISELIKDKPYNLYIRQNYKENTVSVIAQREKDFMKNRGTRTEGVFSAADDLYKEAALGAVCTYEDLTHNTSQSFVQKFKNLFCKTQFKFKLKKNNSL